MATVNQYRAAELLELIQTKHAGTGVVVPECKDGPTQSVSSYLRMDAWVMEKKWRSPRVIAYEIKVSRSDFINDTKWRDYLPYCNEFYFVAPKNMIEASELPPEAGLLEAIGRGHGGRLITRKKAVYRSVEIPDTIYQYILMCRVVIESEHVKPADRAEEWRTWLATKTDNRKLGYDVSKAIREHATELEIKNHELEKRMEAYDNLRQLLPKLGLSEDEIHYRWNLEDRITQHRAIFDADVVRTLKRTQGELTRLLTEIEESERKYTDAQLAKTA